MTSKNVLNNNIKSPYFLSKVYNPFDYYVPLQPINHQKNVFTVNPVIHPQIESSIYNRKYTFNIPKNIGYISELYIESEITCTGDNSIIQDRLGSRIFKKIELETTRGPNLIQSIDDNYINSRIDLLQFKDLYLSSMEPSPSFNNTTSKVYTPLFPLITGFDTNFVEPIQISVKTNDNYTVLGLNTDITAISLKLYIISYTIPSSLRKSYRIAGYNVFNEEPILITTSSTSTKLYLECDKQVNSINMILKKSNQEYFRINSFSLESNGLDLVPTMPAVINHNFSTDIGMTYTFYFNNLRDRTSMASLNLDNLQPLELTINYDTIGSGYYLYIFYEYNTIIDISPLGSINII